MTDRVPTNSKYLAYASSVLAMIIGGSSFIFSKIVMGAGMSFSAMIFWRMLIAVATAGTLYFSGLFPLQLRANRWPKPWPAACFIPGSA